MTDAKRLTDDELAVVEQRASVAGDDDVMLLAAEVRALRSTKPPALPEDVARDAGVIRAKFRRDHQPSGDQYGGVFIHDGVKVDPWEAVSRLEAAAALVPLLTDKAEEMKQHARTVESERDALKIELAASEEASGMYAERSGRFAEQADRLEKERDAAQQEVEALKRTFATESILKREHSERAERIAANNDKLTARVAELEASQVERIVERDAAREQLRDLPAENERLTARVEETESRYLSTLGDLVAMDIHVSALLEAGIHRAEQLEARVAELEAVREEMCTRVSSLQEYGERMRNEALEAEARVAALERELDEFRLSLTPEQQQDGDWRGHVFSSIETERDLCDRIGSHLPDYAWTDSPAEVVGHLMDERDEAEARATAAGQDSTQWKGLAQSVYKKLEEARGVIRRNATEARATFPASIMDDDWIAELPLSAPAPGLREAVDREHLGREVRAEWVAWAKEQANPKASWLVPWEGLSEPDKEVDRRIGVRLFTMGLAAYDAAKGGKAPSLAGMSNVQAGDVVLDLMAERDAAVERAKGAETLRRTAWAAFIGVSEWDEAVETDVRERGDAEALRGVAPAVARHLLGMDTPPSGPGRKADERQPTCCTCGKVQENGAQVYVCEPEAGGCGQDVCSDCSENGGKGGNSVLCLNCHANAPPSGRADESRHQDSDDAECEKCRHPSGIHFESGCEKCGCGAPPSGPGGGVRCPSCEGRGYPGEVGCGRGGQGSCPDCKGTGRDLEAAPAPLTPESLAAVVEEYAQGCEREADRCETDGVRRALRDYAVGAREGLRRALAGNAPRVLSKERVVEVLESWRVSAKDLSRGIGLARASGRMDAAVGIARDLGLTLPGGEPAPRARIAPAPQPEGAALEPTRACECATCQEIRRRRIRPTHEAKTEPAAPDVAWEGDGVRVSVRPDLGVVVSHSGEPLTPAQMASTLTQAVSSLYGELAEAKREWMAWRDRCEKAETNQQIRERKAAEDMRERCLSVIWKRIVAGKDELRGAWDEIHAIPLEAK